MRTRMIFWKEELANSASTHLALKWYRLEGEFFQVISLHLPWLVDQLASKRHFQISNPSGQRGRGRQGDYVGWFVRL